MRLQEIVEDDRREPADSSKHWVIRNERGCLRLNRNGGLKCVRRAKAIRRAKSGCYVGYLKVDRYPFKVGVSGEESVEVVDKFLIAITVRNDQDLGHCKGGGNGTGGWIVEPGENSICQRYVLRVGFYLVDENTAVHRDPTMLAEYGVETV